MFFRLDLWLEENVLNRITQNFVEILVVNYVHDALTNLVCLCEFSYNGKKQSSNPRFAISIQRRLTILDRSHYIPFVDKKRNRPVILEDRFNYLLMT